MRPGKKLLVLDIDYTLFDHRSTAETGYELMRPFLHEFLTAAYQVGCYGGLFLYIAHQGPLCIVVNFCSSNCIILKMIKLCVAELFT